MILVELGNAMLRKFYSCLSISVYFYVIIMLQNKKLPRYYSRSTGLKAW